MRTELTSVHCCHPPYEATSCALIASRFEQHELPARADCSCSLPGMCCYRQQEAVVEIDKRFVEYRLGSFDSNDRPHHLDSGAPPFRASPINRRWLDSSTFNTSVRGSLPSSAAAMIFPFLKARNDTLKENSQELWRPSDYPGLKDDLHATYRSPLTSFDIAAR